MQKSNIFVLTCILFLHLNLLHGMKRKVVILLSKDLHVISSDSKSKWGGRSLLKNNIGSLVDLQVPVCLSPLHSPDYGR